MQLQIFPYFGLLILFISCWGWGTALLSALRITQVQGFGINTALGIVAVIFLGGWQNVFHAATPVGIWIISASGGLLGTALLLQSFREGGFPPPQVKLFLGQLVVILCLAIFLVENLLPAPFFNYNDDFQNYFPRLPRMLATGTLAGNPFEFLGLADLGPISYLQVYALGSVEYSYIPLFDPIFCFCVGVLLLWDIALRGDRIILSAVLSFFLYFLLHPQIANSSATYVNSVLVLTLATLAYARAKTVTDWRTAFAHNLLFGICLGSLLALKTSNVFYVGTLVLLLAVFFNRENGYRSCGIFLCGFFLALLPWIFLHLDKYNLFRWQATLSELAQEQNLVRPTILEAFRFRKSVFGSTKVTLLPAIFWIFLVGGIYWLRSLREHFRSWTHFFLSTNCLAAIVSFLLLPSTTNSEAALRYSMPILLSLIPAICLAPESPSTQHWRWIRKDLFYWSGGLLLCLLCLFFFPSFLNRIQKISQQRSVLAYPTTPQDAFKNAAFFSSANQNYMSSVQERIPPDSSIFVVADVPFLLDFSRNSIVHYGPDWAVTPWHLTTKSAEALLENLQSEGIDYIFWEYNGLSLERHLEFYVQHRQRWRLIEFRYIFEKYVLLLSILRSLKESSRLVFDDGRTALLRDSM